MKSFMFPRVSASLVLSVSLSFPLYAGETDCSSPPKTLTSSLSFVERGHAKTVSRVGSPLATLRHRLAQRALARAQVRAIMAEAAATRQHASHVSHGSPAVMGEADCSTGTVSALPPVPAESK